jgi:hypothetical protein
MTGEERLLGWLLDGLSIHQSRVLARGLAARIPMLVFLDRIWWQPARWLGECEFHSQLLDRCDEVGLTWKRPVDTNQLASQLQSGAPIAACHTFDRH